MTPGMKGVRRKEREPGRTGRPSLGGFGPVLAGLALRAQQMFAAASCGSFYGLLKPLLCPSASGTGVMPLPQLATSAQLLLILDHQPSHSVFIPATTSSMPSPQDKHLVCRKLSPFPWPATSDCSCFQMQTFPPSLSLYPLS